MFIFKNLIKTGILGLFLSISLNTVHATTLDDKNSSFTINPAGVGTNEAWVVDGTNHLSHWDFFYRIGGVTSEVSALPLVGSTVTNTDPVLPPPFNLYFDSRADTLSTHYIDRQHGLEMNFNYKLRGGAEGSRSAKIAFSGEVKNISEERLELYLFEHLDFNLIGTADDDTGEVINPTFYMQNEGGFFFKKASTHSVTPFVAETGITPDILNKILNGNFLDPNNTLAYGDVSTALQWYLALDPGESFLLSETLQIFHMPEPGTYLMLGSFIGIGMLLKKRKERRQQTVS